MPWNHDGHGMDTVVLAGVAGQQSTPSNVPLHHASTTPIASVTCRLVSDAMPATPESDLLRGCLSVRPSVCLSYTVVSNAETAKRLDILRYRNTLCTIPWDDVSSLLWPNFAVLDLGVHPLYTCIRMCAQGCAVYSYGSDRYHADICVADTTIPRRVFDKKRPKCFCTIFYTRNSSGDEIANVNFLYDDIVHAVKIQ